MKINSEKLNLIPASTYKWKVHNGKIEIISFVFCRKVSSLTAPHCQFRGVGQGRKENLSFNNNYIT